MGQASHHIAHSLDTMALTSDGLTLRLPQTMDQFQDFQSFISKIDKYGMQAGIVKVVPPKEW